MAKDAPTLTAAKATSEVSRQPGAVPGERQQEVRQPLSPAAIESAETATREVGSGPDTPAGERAGVLVDVLPAGEPSVEAVSSQAETPQAPEQVAVPESPVVAQMRANETTYLEEHRPLRPDEQPDPKRKVHEGLDARYNSEKSGAAYVLGQMEAYAQEHGILPIPDGLPADIQKQVDNIPSDSMPEERAPAEQAEQTYLKALAMEQVQQAFNVESFTAADGRPLTPEQRNAISVRDMTNNYIELAYAARAEGVGKGLSEADFVKNLSRMVRENIVKLSYQQYAAAENTLGDHGVRHLVDHNITVTEQIAQQLEGKQHMTAADRLMMHQIMIDHDLGYAMDVVRDKVNGTVREADGAIVADKHEEPDFSADGGHNALAAKFVRERSQMTDDPFAAIFTDEQIATIHEGITWHDSSDVHFTVGQEGGAAVKARRDNIMSAIHLADNTHAFETKLAEILYSNPETLKTVILLRIAMESGVEEAKVNEIRAQLQAQIMGHDDWSDQYKTALTKAAENVGPSTGKFAAPRILGTEPSFILDDQGKVSIEVNESPSHRQLMDIFGQKELGQFYKFMRDLGVKEPITSDDTTVRGETDDLTISLRKGTQESADEAAYREKVLAILTTDPMRTLVVRYQWIVLARKFITEEDLPDDQKRKKLDEVNGYARILFDDYQRDEAALQGQQSQQGGQGA